MHSQSKVDAFVERKLQQHAALNDEIRRGYRAESRLPNQHIRAAATGQVSSVTEEVNAPQVPSRSTSESWEVEEELLLPQETSETPPGQPSAHVGSTPSSSEEFAEELLDVRPAGESTTEHQTVEEIHEVHITASSDVTPERNGQSGRRTPTTNTSGNSSLYEVEEELLQVQETHDVTSETQGQSGEETREWQEAVHTSSKSDEIEQLEVGGDTLAYMGDPPTAARDATTETPVPPSEGATSPNYNPSDGDDDFIEEILEPANPTESNSEEDAEKKKKEGPVRPPPSSEKVKKVIQNRFVTKFATLGGPYSF
ncbi:hypothetical protein ADEAN_000605400 [Angomonas deanei]|uniref:Uncharacterized protein n=1 Tax=Angomonas deanei TaxID=59799 RepID=A0A7G2CGU7_9TRYP|nr:hypothetical protein ADEAN_000605400 [Angomonas deanei]